jgi:hypothetical protein
VRCGGGAGCGAGAKQKSKDKMAWFGAVGGCGAKQTSKARAWCWVRWRCCAGAVVDAVRVVLGGCKVKVLGLVRWWVLCGLSYNQVLG